MTFEDVEKARKKYKRKLIITILISLFIVVFIILTSGPSSLVFAILVAVGFGKINVITDENRYTSAFKKYFVRNALKKVFTDLKYMPESGISRKAIEKTGMMHMGDIYSAEDFVSGKYKDISFRQSDINIKKKIVIGYEDGEPVTCETTIFNGRWMIFEFNKNFKADVQVCQKGFKNSNSHSSIFSDLKYQKVQMDSDEFNKMFSVYAENPHDVFYIITPHIMEGILRLAYECEGQKIMLCFVDNKLHVGLYDYKDSFEISSCLFKIDEEEVNKNILSYIQKITIFVDELELDKELFKIKEKK